MRSVFALGFAIMLTLALSAFSANAATFVVNDTSDAQDATPGDGICATAGATCTLRAAITEANALAGADTITLPAGTYTQSLVAAEENANAGGDYDITSSLTINGAGAATTIIQANAAANTATERVFHVLSPGATSVTIDGVTIQNGVAAIVGAEVGRGGGIRAGNNAATDNTINLTVTNSVIKNNYAGTRGGGLAINKGNLTVTNCTFDGNQAGFTTQTTVTGGAGGAVLIDSQDNVAVVGQTATFTNTVMTNNTATTNVNNTFGGAVINRAVDSLATFNGCTITNNHSVATDETTFTGFAGGLYNQQAHMVVNNTLVDSNTTSGQQCGIRNLASTQTAATLDISNSTISNNTAADSAAGISNVVGGAFDGTVNIDHSTVSGNVVTGDAGLAGGILNSADAVAGNGLVNISNSTLSANSAAYAGGIYTDGSAATLLIDFSTFATNTANTAPDSEGGALLQDSTAGGTTFISNSVFADNVATVAGTADLDGFLTAGIATQITSFGYNHVEDGVAFTTSTGDVTSGDPALGSLFTNGGPTKTHLPGAASVVVNTIPNGTGGCGSPINDDQRGFARPIPAAGTCDKGAVERQAVEAGTPTSTNTSTPTNTATFTPTSAFTATSTATATATFTPTPPNCPITVLPNDGGTSANARAPSTRFAGSRAHYLITAAELAAAGYTAGAIPGTIGWTYDTAPVATGSAPLKIYLENTSDTTNLKSATWATAISTMTTVHDATTNLPGTAGPFEVSFTGGTSFTYTGGGLYVAYDWGNYTGTLSTTSVILCNSTGLVGGLLGANSQAATVAASSFRPETRLNGNPPVNNDVAVSYVYTYGEMPLGAVSGHAVRALVTNNSAVALTNVSVTLNITGADTFTDTKVVPSLAACGGQAVVTFAGFTPTALGSDTVTVSVPPDDVNTNNSKSKALNITASDYSYKHPGSTATGGVGFTGATGALVGKFTTNSAQSVSAIKVEFNTVTATAYRLAIYGDSGSGTPSTTALYEDAADRTVTLAGAQTITLPAPVAVPAGNFFVGIQQTNTTNASYSFDNEVIRASSFYEASPLPPATWNDFSPGGDFKLNIGLVLAGTATPTNTATSTATDTPTPTATNTPSGANSVAGTVTYGNPASPTTKFISNATVTATGGTIFSTTTAAPGGTAGQYTLTGFGAGNYTVGVSKTTGQNSITSNDAARIAQHVAGTLLIATDRQKIAADSSNNGTLSSNDAALIARFVSGLGAPIGITNTWRFFVPSVSQPTFPVGASPTTRSYTDPIGVQTGQDFIGILVGETTGNWTATAARSARGPEKNSAVELPNMTAETGKEITIPVNVQGVANKDVISYEFNLRYDPSVIQPLGNVVDVNETVSRGLSVVANPNEPGLLRVVVYGALPIDNDGLLLNLRFTTVGEPGAISPLTWERIMFNEDEAQTLMTNGQVEISY